MPIFNILVISLGELSAAQSVIVIDVPNPSSAEREAEKSNAKTPNINIVHESVWRPVDDFVTMSAKAKININAP
ncbi:MAG: hypothetical protein PWP72_401 [Thermoanaerobacter sp.]|nr:hypothetical protein [Thermoanaerobacter sp.]